MTNQEIANELAKICVSCYPRYWKNGYFNSDLYNESVYAFLRKNEISLDRYYEIRKNYKDENVSFSLSEYNKKRIQLLTQYIEDEKFSYPLSEYNKKRLQLLTQDIELKENRQ